MRWDRGRRRRGRVQRYALEQAERAFQDRGAALDLARAALDDARRRRPHGGGPVTAAYRAVSDALTEVSTVAVRGYGHAVGPVDTLSPTQVTSAQGSPDARLWRRRVVACSTARQEHLLDGDPTTVRQPTVVPTDGAVELGPFWPLLDYLHITEQAPRTPAPRVRAPEPARVRVPAQRPPAPTPGALEAAPVSDSTDDTTAAVPVLVGATS